MRIDISAIEGTVTIEAAELRALAKLASKDGTRPNLQAVAYQQPIGDRGHLVACDGRMLASIPLPEGSPVGDFLIPKQAIESACKVAGAKGSIRLDVAKTQANRHVYMTAADEKGRPLASSETPKPDLEYPSWRQAVPDGKSTKAAMGINPDLLFAAALAVRGDNKAVRLELSGDEIAPIRIVGADGSVGVVMACRM